MKAILVRFSSFFLTLIILSMCIITPIEVKAETWIPMGTFEITHYCSCSRCCGNNHLTYSGTTPTRYKTIAVDPNVIPIGSVVYIETYGYRVAEDIGSAIKGKHIDVFTNTHAHALELGVQYHKVYIVKE